MFNDTHMRGFTLVEVLVSLMVAAILAALAVPAFRTFVQNNRDITQANSLVYSLDYARSEAIKRDLAGGVTVCPSVDNKTCSGSVDWTTGWIVWLTAAGGAVQILQAAPALTGGNTVNASLPTGVTFTSNGLVTAPLTIKICDARGATYARSVEINATGRVATSQNAGFSVAGAALTCP